MNRWGLASVLLAANCAHASTMAEYNGRCELLHFGKKVFDETCRISVGPESASGTVFVYRLQPVKGAGQDIRAWANASTVNGVPAMQVATEPKGPLRFVTAEGDDVLFTAPPKGLEM